MNRPNKIPTVADNWQKAILAYKEPLVRNAIWEMKYRGNREITKRLAKVVYEFLLAEVEDWQTFSNFIEPIIIPVPITKKRKVERGFNQSERLSIYIDKLDRGHNFGVKLGLLEKVKETPKQSLSKSRSERLENLKGSFKVKEPEQIRGRNIIILDDVITTGATMREIKKCLKQAGARKVVGVAVAH